MPRCDLVNVMIRKMLRRKEEESQSKYGNFFRDAHQVVNLKLVCDCYLIGYYVIFVLHCIGQSVQEESRTEFVLEFRVLLVSSTTENVNTPGGSVHI